MDKKGVRHGEGVLTFPKKEARYHGLFEGGAMVKGTITYLKAEVDTFFTGTFKNGQWHIGIFTKGHTTYEGLFENNAMTGKFLVKWLETGKRYDGYLQNDKLHGEGELSFEWGEIALIKGTWSEGELQKCTLLTRRDGSTADNYEVSSGKLVGEGTVKVENSTYTGTWDENGLLNGEGQISNENES